MSDIIIKKKVNKVEWFKTAGHPGACPGCLKGGGGPISLGSLKKRSSDFKRGGSNGQMGGPVH